METTLILGLAAWTFVGMASIVYVWTDNLDYTLAQVPVTIVAGCIGGFSLLIWAGWIAFKRHGLPLPKNRTLLKARHKIKF